MTDSPSDNPNDKISLEIGYMKEGHTVVGHLSYLKVLDNEGDFYWASRSDGINMMEQLGMAYDMVREIEEDLKRSRRNPGEPE
jgi:hypothetical protein